MFQVLPNLKAIVEESKKHRLRLYGWRDKHPITGKRSWHNGIDLACATGTPILSPWKGFVYQIGNDSLNGNYLKIRHPDHPDVLETAYAHLSAFPAGWPKPRETMPEKIWVEEGDVIGYVGNTGGSKGSHLHFIIRLRKSHFDGDRNRLDVNPLPYLESSLGA